MTCTYELGERKDLNYPPSWRLAMFRITSNDERRGEEVAETLVKRAEAIRRQFKATPAASKFSARRPRRS